MHDPQEWITRLNMSGKPLSKGQKRIAEYISCHYEKAVSMTAVMLGRQCGVSESTVVRFAMALGYEGYPEMQEKLRSMVRQRLTAEQRVGMMDGDRPPGGGQHGAEKRPAKPAQDHGRAAPAGF